MKKRWLAAAFAAVAAGCLLTGGLVSAGAETPAEQTGAFAFVNGASVRYSDPTGLRFTVQMDAATYTGLVEAGAYKDGRSMSVYIAPADYFESAAGDYAAVAKRAVEAEIGADKIYQNVEEYGSGIYLANAVLTNVLYENVNREFQAIAAIESTEGTEWSEPSDVRSVAYVASAALTEEETDETQSAVLNGFVQKALAEANDVAEEEFNEDGKYEVAVSMESELFLEPEGSETLALSVSPAADLYVKWTSDNPDVATVDENGKVTAVSKGAANITAEVCGKTATCAVTVDEIKLASITVTLAEEYSMLFEDSDIDSLKEYLTVTGINNDGSAYNGGAALSAEEYTLQGTLTGGESTLTVAVEGVTATFTVNVMERIEIDSAEEFAAITENDASYHYYTLTQNIDFTEYLAENPWTTENNLILGTFSGVLDGNGHKVTGIVRSATAEELTASGSGYSQWEAGIFHTIAETAVVRNLYIEMEQAYGRGSLFAAYVHGTLRDCYIKSSVTVTDSSYWGQRLAVIHQASGTITRCIFESVTGNDNLSIVYIPNPAGASVTFEENMYIIANNTKGDRDQIFNRGRAKIEIGSVYSYKSVSDLLTGAAGLVYEDTLDGETIKYVSSEYTGNVFELDGWEQWKLENGTLSLCGKVIASSEA